MKINYEIRTRADRTVHAYDNEERAREEISPTEKRMGVPLKLVKVTQVEEELIR